MESIQWNQYSGVNTVESISEHNMQYSGNIVLCKLAFNITWSQYSGVNIVESI